MTRVKSFFSPNRLNHTYMFFFSLNFSFAFWVIFLRSRGLSFVAIGLLETIYHVTSFFAEIPTGLIADHWGRRTSLVLGRAASVLAAVLTLTTRSFPLLAVAFVLSALSNVFHSGAFEAIVYDELVKEGKEQEFTRKLGRLNGTFLIGGAIAALTGGVVAGIALALLYILNIASDLLALVALSVFPEFKPTHGIHSVGPWTALRESVDFCLENRGIIGLFLLSGFIGACATTTLFFGQSYMREASVPLALIGVLGMLTGLAAVMPARAAHAVEAKLGWRSSLGVGTILIGGTLILIGFMPRFSGPLPKIALLVGFLFYNAIYECLYPIISNRLNSMIPSSRRATLLSANGMAFSIFMMMVFPFFGWLGDTAGLSWGYMIIGGSVILLGVLLSLLQRDRDHKKRLSQKLPSGTASWSILTVVLVF